MIKTQIYFILFLLFLAGCLFVYYYIFNIYEVIYTIRPKELFADNISTVEICTIPLNSFGQQAPLRHSYTEFNVGEGSELVDIISENRESGRLVLRAKNRTGKVIVFIKSEHAILPSSVEINIYPNLASNKDKGIKNT